VFARKSNNNWLKVSTAMIGGFLLGFSYKKYGKNLANQWRKIKRNMDYNDFVSSEDSEV